MGFVASRAEFLQAIAKCIYNFWSRADDHSEEVFFKEARRGESEAILLSQELLAEAYVILDANKFVDVDADHHIHCCTAADRGYASDGRQAEEGGF